MAAKIVEELKVIRDYEKVSGNTFKVRAYNNVIDQIQKLSQSITTVDDLKAAGITGIGKSIEAKITEILSTGELEKAEGHEAQQARLSAFNSLSQVHGIGQAKATSLIDAGITTIAELRDALTKDPKLLNDVQKIGLLRYESLQKRIPRKEMLKHEETLIAAFAGSFTATLAGSFRRGHASSGDIDVLLRPVATGAETAFHDCITSMKTKGYITDILALGDKKCMAIVKLPRSRTYRRLDLLLTPEHEYPFALLYFTGSKEFNVHMRSHALAKGYTLNEHKLLRTSTGKQVPPVPQFQTEEEIFEFLGMEYVAPEKRIFS
jgi:DNA polymerase beta